MSQIAESTASVAQTPSSDSGPASLPWIKKLVSFDTVSRNPNLGLIETVRDELRAAGIESTLTTDPSRQMGQPVRHRSRARRRDERRHRAVGPYGRGACRWPEMGQRSVQAGNPRRPAVRPRHVRHEGLYRRVAELVAEDAGHETREADPLRALLRRRSRLRRRAADDHRPAKARLASGWLHRRRADQHAADHRAQGHQRVQLLRARVRGAFVADAEGLERDRIRGAADLLYPRRRRSIPRARPVRRTVRRALHDRADQHDQWRQRDQHGAGRMQFRVRIPQSADARS